MTKQKIELLLDLLNQYYKEKSKTCNYDCYNCELGILEGYGDGHSCAIETIEREVSVELYEMLMSRN